VSYALGFAWLLSLIGGLAVWTFWPAAIGGPMLANYVHGPVLVAALLAFPLMARLLLPGAARPMCPNLSPNADVPHAGCAPQRAAG